MRPNFAFPLACNFSLWIRTRNLLANEDLESACAPSLRVSTEMISNWVPNPIKCFLLSVIVRTDPLGPFLFRRRRQSLVRRCARHGKTLSFSTHCIQKKREIESRRQLFLFLARLACVRSMILLLRWWRAPLLSKFTHQNPVHNNHHLMAAESQNLEEWKRVHVRDLMCHPSLPALCRLHFIILCVRERELTLPPWHNQKLLGTTKSY